MAFIAKSAAPVAPAAAARHWTFDRAALGGLTSFVAPPGYLLSEGLFEALQRQGRPVIWVRLGPEDRDPGTFLRTLAAATERHHPGFGWPEAASGGWVGRFQRLAATLAAAAPAPASLVVEHAHHLGGTTPGPEAPDPAGPALLGVLLAPLLDEDRACIVTSDAPLPAGALPARGATVTADGLRLGPGAAGELLGREAPRLPAAAARRAADLCRGAAADLVAVCGAATALGPARVERAVDRAGQVEDLLAELASGWLEGAGADGHRALALALQLGYSHPALSAAVLGRAAAAAAGRRLVHAPGRLARPAAGRPGPGPPPGRRDGPPGGRLPARPGRPRARRPPLSGAGGPGLRRRGRRRAGHRPGLAPGPRPGRHRAPGPPAQRPPARPAQGPPRRRGRRRLAQRPRPLSAQVPGHPPRPLAAAGAADGRVLARGQPGRGPQQPERGRARAAAGVPGPRQRAGGGAGG